MFVPPRPSFGGDDPTLAVIGLGYVGLPLAAAFGRRFDTVGYDLRADHVDRLRAGGDPARGVSAGDLARAARLRLTARPDDLVGRDVYVVAVPTPVDDARRPDLGPLLAACRTVGRAMRPGALVVFESTVYPGCTEEDCAPALARAAGLAFNRDFFCGYSPERINPGDPDHTLENIVKVTAGSTPAAADAVDRLYRAILAAGTYRAPSIRVAEAAKVIENAQRDLNIAFVNELAMIFRRLGLDTRDVLDAAATKWNFLRFSPGLVGGHCIGVDPYYLTHKAQAAGYDPEVILAGRRVNDGMGAYVAGEIAALLARRRGGAAGARVLQLGVAFKENCADVRNSKAVDVARGLEAAGCAVTVFDPLADPEEVRAAYGFASVADAARLERGAYDAVVLAVAHRAFAALDARALGRPDAVVYDIKGVLPRDTVDGRL